MHLNVAALDGHFDRPPHHAAPAEALLKVVALNRPCVGGAHVLGHRGGQRFGALSGGAADGLAVGLGAIGPRSRPQPGVPEVARAFLAAGGDLGYN